MILDPEAASVTIPLNLLKRLVGAAAGIAPDRDAVELGRAEIEQAEALLRLSGELRADG